MLILLYGINYINDNLHRQNHCRAYGSNLKTLQYLSVSVIRYYKGQSHNAACTNRNRCQSTEGLFQKRVRRTIISRLIAVNNAKYNQNHKRNTNCKYDHVHITQGKFHFIFQHCFKCFHYCLPPHQNTTNTHLQTCHKDCLQWLLLPFHKKQLFLF